MEGKFNVSDKEQKAVEALAKALAEVSGIMINKMEDAKKSMNETDAKNFAEIWEQKDGEKTMNELRQTVENLNRKIKTL